MHPNIREFDVTGLKLGIAAIVQSAIEKEGPQSFPSAIFGYRTRSLSTPLVSARGVPEHEA
jgi:hypothetical protein